MISWLWLIPTLIIGGTVGFLAAALCAAAGKKQPTKK
jgi:hypothetical protein